MDRVNKSEYKEKGCSKEQQQRTSTNVLPFCMLKDHEGDERQQNKRQWTSHQPYKDGKFTSAYRLSIREE